MAWKFRKCKTCVYYVSCCGHFNGFQTCRAPLAECTSLRPGKDMVCRANELLRRCLKAMLLSAERSIAELVRLG